LFRRFADMLDDVAGKRFGQLFQLYKVSFPGGNFDQAFS